ncbi:MAG TPA: class I SAM-dependent methyltransferase [Trichormus sp. M33_DOE_039]|nr:class I SAM-dependent methyltransferase [Trichormus sp. M33_DOE_039]
MIESTKQENFTTELEQIKAEYLNPNPGRKVDQKIINLVSEFVIPRLSGDRILELGVGDQIWTPKLLEKFASVTSIDASPGLLVSMQEKLADHPNGKQWSSVCSFFEDYQPDELFDTVLATFVLDLVDNPSLILRLAYQNWLKPGGKLVVVVPHALSLHRRLSVKLGLASYPGEFEPGRQLRHKHDFTCYEMAKLITEVGFEIIEQKGMFTKALPNSGLVSCSDEQLRGLFELGLDLPIEYSATIYFLAEKKLD